MFRKQSGLHICFWDGFPNKISWQSLSSNQEARALPGLRAQRSSDSAWPSGRRYRSHHHIVSPLMTVLSNVPHSLQIGPLDLRSTPWRTYVGRTVLGLLSYVIPEVDWWQNIYHNNCTFAGLHWGPQPPGSSLYMVGIWCYWEIFFLLFPLSFHYFNFSVLLALTNEIFLFC